MKTIQVSLTELVLAVACAAAFFNLVLVLTPHWGTLCRIAWDASTVLH
jgi:hypothetical protein